ncbi:T-complex protein 11-domain-containing protein [Phascolomyces articulosus]|uniref:T-complex protein 11-domain-containing protein n=1 Tax=Phascolomyces articulosus TaxID=60185 RepID=A0AAD5K1F3_9FUNG|nr:T-complex protein 11-domain-containing protein [Phascolomyces articulosus]
MDRTTAASSYPQQQSQYNKNDIFTERGSNSSAATTENLIIVDAFHSINLPRASDKQTWIDFESLSELIARPCTISTAASVLDMFLSPPPKNINQRNRRARVFLTAYVILTCPESILQEAPIPQRKRLRLAARRLLVNFENWISPTTNTPAAIATTSTSDANSERTLEAKMRSYWAGYVTLFQNWLSNDKEQLLAGMVAHYQELLQTRITIQKKTFNVAETDNACKELDNQIVQVEQKIVSMGGTEILERVKNDTSDNRNNQSENYNSNNNIENSLNNETPIQEQHELHQILSTAASNELTNERLAHEIIVNPNFKLERQHHNSIERQVTEIATKAYFDKLSHDMENSNKDNTYNEIIPQLLQDLLEVAIETELQEAIDVNLIKQQLAQNVFDLDKMIDFILDMIQRSCASIRDATVQEIRNSNSCPIDKIRFIFDLLQDMALDLVNHQLHSLRPHLLPIAVEYGRSKFNQAMQEQGILNTLPKTKEWLREAVNRLQKIASQRNPENIIMPPTPPTSQKEVYDDAMTSLIMSSELIDASMCPETLRLDMVRLQEYQNEAQAITIVAALLTLARNFGVPTDYHGDLAERLFILLEQQDTTIDHLASEIYNNASSDKKIKDLNDMIHVMVDKTLSHTDAIYSLLSRRVLAVIKTCITNSNSSMKQNEKLISDTMLQSYGLFYVRDPLHKLCVRISALADYNYRVHGQWYEETLEQFKSL